MNETFSQSSKPLQTEQIELQEACPLKKNDILLLEVQSLTTNAVAVSHYGNYTIHFENAIVGEKVRVKIIKVLKNFAFAKLVEIVEKSPERIDILDVKGYQTGTMPLQHMSYTSQLAFKQKVVQDYMNEFEIGACVTPTLGMDILDTEELGAYPLAYRNKAQIPVRRVDGNLETGLFRKNTHELIPIENYCIQDTKIDKAIVQIRDILRAFKVVPYDEEKHEGNLRNIIVRRGYATGQIMIILVTRKAKLFQADKIVDKILTALPEVVSIVQNIHTERNNNVMGSRNVILYGQDCYEDEILGLSFNISSKSFYQVNTKQTEVLYKQVIDLADLNGTEIVLDAYCGIGTIGLCMAGKAKQVYGIEIVEDAVNMAKLNAKRNGIVNAQFRVGSVQEQIPVLLEELKERGEKLDVIVVDPPRKGLETSFIDAVTQSKCEKLIYVSCNPKSLARDLALLSAEGFRAQCIQPVDMFPLSTHVECVVLLVKDN